MATGETVEESVMFRLRRAIDKVDGAGARKGRCDGCVSPVLRHSDVPVVVGRAVQKSVTGVTTLVTSLIVFGVPKSSEYPLGDPLIRLSVGGTVSVSEFAVRSV